MYSKTKAARAAQRQQHEESTRQWWAEWGDAHRMMNWKVSPERVVAHLEWMLLEHCDKSCLTCRSANGLPCRTLKSKVITAPHQSRTVTS